MALKKIILNGTEIELPSGGGSDNIPTKTSELTNDSGFITTDDIPKEVELIEISGDMLADEPIYTAVEAQAIIDAYNANKLIAIKCGTRINFGKGWFIPNINIRTQSGMSQIFLSGILGNYYIEHRIIYNTSAGTISVSAQSLIDLSESGGVGAEPMVCAYRISSYTANHIELDNYTYNGQTMDYREGAIISITNPLREDVVFEGGTLTLDGNKYETDAFTLKVGATILFSLGVDPGFLYEISSIGGATTTYVDEAIANAITNTLNTPV